MRTLRGVVVATAIGALLPIAVHAFTYDVMIRAADVTIQPSSFFAGDRVRVYATVRNIGDRDVQGNVFFSENGTAIGTPPPFSVKAKGMEEEVWVDWQPAVVGDRQIFVRIVSAPETGDEDSTNNEMIIPIIVRERPPPPPTVPVSGGTAGSGTSSGTATGAVSGSAPAPTAPVAAAPPSAPAPAAASSGTAKPRATRTASPPVVAAVPSAKTATATTAANAPSPAAPTSPKVPPSPPLTPAPPYDASIRELLGTAASPWRLAVPIAAGVIALIGAIVLALLFFRRRSSDTADHGTPPPSLDRRSRRTR